MNTSQGHSEWGETGTNAPVRLAGASGALRGLLVRLCGVAVANILVIHQRPLAAKLSGFAILGFLINIQFPAGTP